MHYLTRAKEINDRLLGIYARNNVSVLDTVPRRIQIIPTMRCNYRCVMCFQSEAVHRQDTEIDFALLQKLGQVFPFVKEVYFTGGEPLLYSAFAETMEYLAQFGCELSMSTNGALLRGRRLEMAFRHMRMIKVSLDAARPETYANIRRNGDLGIVVANLTDLVKMKIRNRTQLPELNCSMVAMHSNIAELPELVRLAHSLGMRSVRVAHASLHSTQEDLTNESLFFHKEESDHYMVEAAAVARECKIQLLLPSLFAETANSNGSPLTTYDTGVCHEPWEYLLLNPDGTTALCCSNCVGGGDLTRQSFEEIWNSEVAQHLRRRLNTDREPAACANCLTHKRQGKAAELPEALRAQASAP